MDVSELTVGVPMSTTASILNFFGLLVRWTNLYLCSAKVL